MLLDSLELAGSIFSVLIFSHQRRGRMAHIAFGVDLLESVSALEACPHRILEGNGMLLSDFLG